MKFTGAIILAFTAATVAANAVPAAPSATKVALTPVQKCLQKCDPQSPNWADCAAGCENVPHPSTPDTEQTRNCAAKCPQGNGSPEQTKQYAACLQSCYTSHYYSSNTPVPATQSTGVTEPTGTPMKSPAGTTTTGSSPQKSGSSSSGKGGSKGKNASSTSSGKSSKSSPSNAATGQYVAGPVAGLAGVVMAMFAL